MFNGNWRNFLCGVILALTVGVGGCITMPDGSSQPDYVMIEFGSVAAFTVIVNETKVPNDAVVKAYNGLSAMEAGLQAVVDGSGELDLSGIDAMFASAVPMEYKALAQTGSKLIRSRVKQYMDVKLPENITTEQELIAKISLAVVQGAKSAIEPKYNAVK